MKNPNGHTRRLIAIRLGLFVFSIYLLTYRGGFHSVDEVSMFAVTENLVKSGQVNTDQIAWTQWTTSQAEAQGFFGHDGHVYSKKGLALSLAQAPLYVVALSLPDIGMLQTVSLLNAGLTALTVMLLFLFVRRLSYGPVTAVATALIYGVATIGLVYAKYMFSEPLAGFLLSLTVYMLFVYRQEGGWHHTAIAGLAAGFAVLTRANNLFLVPIFGLYLLWVLYHRPAQPSDAGLRPSPLNSRPSLTALISFGLGLAVPGLILLAYNAHRSGNPLETGYDLTLFSSNFGLGLYKLLFSPLRGLFVYSPILLLSLPGWWRFQRRYRAEAWLLLGCVAVTIGLFSFWASGEGLSWGSRFLVPVVPFFGLMLAPVVAQVTGEVTGGRVAESQVANAPPTPNNHARHHAPRTTPDARRPTPYVLRSTFYLLLPLSLLIQILGIAINPWVYLAQLQADFGGEFFLENTAALYDFRQSQIVGQLQSWSMMNSDLAWLRWGFDPLAFGLTVGLIGLNGWYLGRTINRPHQLFGLTATASLIGVTLVGSYLLLVRYNHTDRQFGPPDDAYTQALETAIQHATPDDSIVTVAQNHYHVPMNRFKARRPLVGLAQQPWPLPPSARLLLDQTQSGQNVWLITVGFPPAAANNATEKWLTLNTYKINEVWLDDSVRLVRYSAQPPTTVRRMGAFFGPESLELRQVEVTKTAAAGQSMAAAFTWQARQPPTTNYHLFLQLLNGDGSLVAQHDSPPNGGYSPTTTWPPDQPIISRHALALPPDLSPGEYRLIAGLYDPVTGQRLIVNDSADFVDLGPVMIMEAEQLR